MGSEYEVDLETARAIRTNMRHFIDTFPPGTKVHSTVMGEDVPMVVTGMSKCPHDERLPCEIELQHERYGGYANYSVSAITPIGTATLTITGADFPHPAEYVIAKQQIGINVVEDKDWCIIPQGEVVPKYCSKRRW
jgi:hypothetical protein